MQNMAKSHKSCMEQAEIIDTFGTYQEVPVETSSRRHAGPRHTFVGFVTESPEPARSIESLTNTSEKTSDTTSRPSDGSWTDVGSIRSVGSGRLGIEEEEYISDFPYFEP